MEVNQMKYKLFFTPMCPNCPKIKEFLKTVKIEGEFIDATTPEGLEEAKKYEVAGVPAVLFLDGDDVVSTAKTIDEVKKVVENKQLI